MNEKEGLTPRKKLVIKLACALFIVLILCTLLSRSIYNMLLPVVETVQPSGGSLSEFIEADGALTYIGTTELRAASDWIVAGLDAVKGAILEAGAPILTVDIEEAALVVSRLELALMEVKNQLDKMEKDPPADAQRKELELQLRIAEEERDAYRESHPDEVSSPQMLKLELAVYQLQTQLEGYVFHTPEEEKALRLQLLAAQTELENYKASEFYTESAQMNKLELAVLQLENKLAGEKPDSTEGDIALLQKQIAIAAEELALQKEKYPSGGVLSAPAAGTLVELNVKKGDTVKKGQLVAALTNEETTQGVRFELSPEAEKDYRKAKSISVTLVGADGSGANAKDVVLTAKSSEWVFDEEKGVWNVMAAIEYDKPISSGTKIKVRLQKNSGAYQIVVPRSCLRKDPGSGKYTVLVVEERDGLFSKENVLRETEVEVLEENNLKAAISAAELYSNTKIVSHSTKPVSAGTVVSLGEVTT